MTPKDRMTFDEACRELSVSESELERLVAAGEIASIKEGDTLYFKKDAVRRFKESREKEPTVLLSDDELNLLDEDVEEIDLLSIGAGSAEEGETPGGTTDLLAGKKGNVLAGKKGGVKKTGPAADESSRKREIKLDEEEDLLDIGLRKEAETADLGRGDLGRGDLGRGDLGRGDPGRGPAARKKEEAGVGAGDDTILNLDSLLEEESEGTTPIPSGEEKSLAREGVSLGDDTLLDTELLDLGEEGDTFEADTAEDLTVDDLTEQGTLLRGGGARVMQMKRKKSHALWTALLATCSLLLLLPLGILINMVFVSSGEAPTSASAKDAYAWIVDFNFLNGPVEGIADLFKSSK